MTSAMKQGEKCPCGADLPWHLFRLDIEMKHLCSCERGYKCDRLGRVEFDPNPDADVLNIARIRRRVGGAP